MHCHPLSVISCCSSHPSLCHRFGGNHPCRLDSWQKVFISSLLPLLGRMHNYCLLLLIWFPFMVPEASSCHLCMHTTWAGSVVTRTLLFHTYYSCAGSIIGSCTHNRTMHLWCMCSHRSRWMWRYRLRLWGPGLGKSLYVKHKYMCRGGNSWPCDDVDSYYCLYWGCDSWATWKRAKHAALLNCTPGTCNLVNFAKFLSHLIGTGTEYKG
jgi:hypothetical protein